MGKKGKHAGSGEGGGKGSRIDWQRSLPSAIQTARDQAYDHHALAKKQESLSLNARKPKSYLLLRNLLESRVNDDYKEKKGDTSWISTLTAASFGTKQHNEEKERKAQRILIETEQILQCAYSNVSYESTIVPSLTKMALKTIAQHIDCYDITDLKRLLKSLPPQVTQLLSIMATEYDTLTNENIELLSSNTTVRSLTMGGMNVSDEGISHLVTLFSHLNSHYQWDAPDDWEDSLLLHEQDCELERHMVRLKQLTLINLNITLHGFQTLQFSVVEELIVHHMEFRQDRAKSSFHNTALSIDNTICDVFFGYVQEGFPLLKKLTVSYCTWCTITSLVAVAGNDFLLQKLPYLRDLVIIGIDMTDPSADLPLLKSIFTFTCPQITLQVE